MCKILSQRYKLYFDRQPPWNPKTLTEIIHEWYGTGWEYVGLTRRRRLLSALFGFLFRCLRLTPSSSYYRSFHGFIRAITRKDSSASTIAAKVGCNFDIHEAQVGT